MNYNKNQKLGLGIFLIFLTLVMAGLLINSYYKKELATNSHVVACVKIEGVYFRKGGVFVEFGYSFNQKNYHTGFLNEGSITWGNYQQYKSGTQNILIVFLRKDPKVFQILRTDNDFLKFNIIPSDTVGIKCETFILDSSP